MTTNSDTEPSFGAFVGFAILLLVNSSLVSYAFSLETKLDDGTRLYWSRDLAIAVWIGGVPALYLFFAMAANTKGWRFLAGFLIVVATHLAQSLGYVLYAGLEAESAFRKVFLSDDVWGLFLLVDGASLCAFLSGSLFQGIIQKEFAKSMNKS